MTKIERLPIWVRYTKKPTDRKCRLIERALESAGARFAVHLGQLGMYSDVDWMEDDDGLWIEAKIPTQNTERAVSELRACGCVAGIGEADWSLVWGNDDAPIPQLQHWRSTIMHNLSSTPSTCHMARTASAHG